MSVYDLSRDLERMPIDLDVSSVCQIGSGCVQITRHEIGPLSDFLIDEPHPDSEHLRECASALHRYNQPARLIYR